MRKMQYRKCLCLQGRSCVHLCADKEIAAGVLSNGESSMFSSASLKLHDVQGHKFETLVLKNIFGKIRKDYLFRN